MRGALLNHPKVIAITRALHAKQEFREWLTPGGGGQMNGQIVGVTASRCVTVALLMCVWSAAREHGKFIDDDLVLPFSEIDDLDQMAGAPGVGQAMLDVEWALLANGVTLPNFKEFNVPMTAAERAKNYRDSHKDVTEPSQNTRDENSEIVTPREEKRREEIKEQNIGASGLPIEPSNIPYKEIATLFNEHMGKLPMVRELTLRRRQLIRGAWQAAKKRQDLKFWKAYFEECSDDQFLNGTGPYGKGHENWRPSFDYLLKNDVITRVYEKAMSRGD
jgi:hypothetical protein